MYLAVSNSRFTNKEAAERAGYKENTFYQHIRQENLDFKIMVRYGKAIKHDFSSEYPDVTEYQTENSVDLMVKESKPYLELLAKYTALLETNNKLLVEINSIKQDLNDAKAELLALKNKEV